MRAPQRQVETASQVRLPAQIVAKKHGRPRILGGLWPTTPVAERRLGRDRHPEAQLSSSASSHSAVGRRGVPGAALDRPPSRPSGRISTTIDGPRLDLCQPSPQRATESCEPRGTKEVRLRSGLNRHCVDLPVLLESLGDRGGSVGRAIDDRTVGLPRRRWMMRTQRVTARSPQSRDSLQAAG